MAEKIPIGSTLNLKPTPRQVRAITRMASQLGDRSGIEHTPVNRREARDLIYKLRIQLKDKGR